MLYRPENREGKTPLKADKERKRWNVEPYHKSLKQNASLEKSPTQTVATQTNHFFAALCGYIKLELLKSDTKLNHFALKSKLYLSAIHSAYQTLRQLNPAKLAAEGELRAHLYLKATRVAFDELQALKAA